MITGLRGTVVVIGIAVSWWWVCIYKAQHQVADKGATVMPGHCEGMGITLCGLIRFQGVPGDVFWG
jgi:hypothetical protein